LRTQGP